MTQKPTPVKAGGSMELTTPRKSITAPNATRIAMRNFLMGFILLVAILTRQGPPSRSLISPKLTIFRINHALRSFFGSEVMQWNDGGHALIVFHNHSIFNQQLRTSLLFLMVTVIRFNFLLFENPRAVSHFVPDRYRDRTSPAG